MVTGAGEDDEKNDDFRFLIREFDGDCFSSQTNDEFAVALGCGEDDETAETDESGGINSSCVSCCR